MEQLTKYQTIFTKNIRKFREELLSFFSELTFTLDEEDLETNVEQYMTDYFYDISPLLIKIVSYSISLDKPIILFKDLDLSNLLQNPLHRDSIHNYLYILYFCTYQYLLNHPNKQLTEQETSTYQEVVSSYYNKKQQTPETPAPETNTFGLPNLGGLFGENSGMFGNLVGNIAKDVMSEINVNDLGDPSELLSNPMDLLGMITGKGGKQNKLSNLFNKITEKITKTMESSEIDQEQLVNEAQSFMGKMGGLGGLGNLTKAMNFSQTQDRLRKKLEARKQLAATTEQSQSIETKSTTSVKSSLRKKKNKKKRKKKH